jgi:glycerol-3-phosphate cytidylyltransferase-like family protein
MNENERIGVVKSIKYVDMIYLSEDTDKTVCKTLINIAEQFFDQGYELIFANGGDRNCSMRVPETDICEHYNIKMIFDCGGTEKLNSSSNINKLLGKEE